MKKEKNIEMLDNEIDEIISNIRIIENQINNFEKIKFLLFNKKKSNKKRVEELEYIRRYLLKRLEYKLNVKNYLE